MGRTTKFSKDDGKLYDVVAVGIDDSKIIWVERKKTLPNAEAIVRMAVMRQGVEDGFFSEVPHGLYKEGDTWHGQEGADTAEQAAPAPVDTI